MQEWSEKYFDFIDILTAQPSAVRTTRTHPDSYQFPLDRALIEAGFVSIARVEDWKPDTQAERSFWVMDAEGRCTPETYALAALKFGLPDLAEGVIPMWDDGNPFNRTLDNIVLLKKPHIRNSYGVPAGSKEYQKKYYRDPERHEKNKNRARQRAADQRERVRQARLLLAREELKELASGILLPDARKGSIDEKFIRSLEDPKVQSHIVNIAVTLMDENPTLDGKDALHRARDIYLDAISNVEIHTSDEEDESEERDSL